MTSGAATGEPTRVLEPRGLDQLGRGVALHKGRPVLIPGALPGDSVRCRIVVRRRNHDEAVIESILRSAPERVQARCEHFSACGGCNLQHLRPDAQVELKQRWLLDTLKRIGGVEPTSVLEPLRGPQWNYRRKARLAVSRDRRSGRVVVGFRGSGSTPVCELRRCEVLHAAVCDVMGPLGELVGRLTVRAQVPQIEVTVGEGECVLSVRALSAPTEEDTALLQRFGERRKLRMLLDRGPDHGVRSLDGKPALLHYELPEFGLTMAFLPTHFVQVNAEMNRAMVSRAVELLDPGPEERLLDLFCGLGNFTLPLATRAGHVTGIDGDPSLVDWAAGNARQNGRSNVSYQTVDLTADQTNASWLQHGYDAILLDPPRTGAIEILPSIGKLGARRILYVSCDPRTLARDIGFLVREYGYQLELAGIMDMFPHTSHVESIAFLWLA